MTQTPPFETNAAAAESFIRRLSEVTSDYRTSFDEKVGQILSLGSSYLGLEVAILARIDGDAYHVVQAHDPSGTVRTGQVLDLPDTVCRRTYAATEPFGFHTPPGPSETRHPAHGTGIGAYLGTAVRLGDQLYGTLNFSSLDPRPEAFSAEEWSAVRIMGQWVGFELLRAQNEDAVRRKDGQLERLLAAANRMNTDLTVERVLQEVADSATEVLNCRYAALGVLNPEGTALDQFVVSGIDEVTREKIGDLPTGKGLLGLLIREPRPHRVADLNTHPAARGFPAHHPPMTSFLGVPILGPTGPIGNLYCTEKRDDAAFSADDESAAEVLAAEAAIAIENARLVNRLRTLQVARDRFYAMVNHELRNALTGVYGWAELMLRKAGDDPPVAVRETVESAEYAIELLNDLLDLSRLDAERIEPEITRCDAAALVREAIAVCEPSARDHGVALEVDGADAVPCHTDPKRVRQILVNLIRNAIRHSGDRAVRVTARTEGDQVVMAVIDRGEGIDPAQQAIIFDAFKRAESQAGGGTGLGLTLSRRLARVLGGDIDLQSRLGHGATFTVRIARSLG